MPQVLTAGIIIESGQEIATVADILANSRLLTVPATGMLTIELQAADNDATNNMVVTVQMPGGDNPMTGVRVPCGNSTGLAGVLDSRTALIATFPIQQGGHPVISCVETGDTELTWRVTYTPL